ncbi:MAG: hypothetical protein IPG50_26250 [Myxococcales bacterium]|nr:hypothetical protein [Myxococcales bacterium]
MRRRGDIEMPERATTPGPAYTAWLRYLQSLADDGDCAVAASLTYKSLPVAARTAWLDALDEDAARLEAPAFALYAPLLAVEHDAELCARIREAIGELPRSDRPPEALAGADEASGMRVAVLVRPAYLEFIDIVACRYTLGSGISRAVHEPMRRQGELPTVWDGVALRTAPFDDVIEELAHAILADARLGRAPNEALVPFADLFGWGAPP